MAMPRNVLALEPLVNSSPIVPLLVEAPSNSITGWPA